VNYIYEMRNRLRKTIVPALDILHYSVLQNKAVSPYSYKPFMPEVHFSLQININ